MRPFTFIHTADCHLDTPFEGIGREDPALAARLREAQRAAFDDLIALCIERKAAFLIIAGDLYDVAERSLTTRVRLREAFRRLAGAGIEVFLATGNHDNLAETQRGLDFPPNVHMFSTDQPETFLWPAAGALPGSPSVAVTGISYGQRAIADDLTARFPPPRDGLFNIAVLHCNVDGDPAHDNYAPCRLDDLLRAGHDYWALGHIHQRRVLAEGQTTIVYPGCIQGRKITETGEKGATAVSVNERGVVRLESVALNRIEWVVAEATVSGVESDEALAELLRARAEELAVEAAPRIEGLVVRWRLRGRLACKIADQSRTLEFLREGAFSRDPFLWTESMDASEAVPARNLEALAEEISPRGDLVRLVQQIRGDSTKVDALRDWLLERPGPPEHASELGIEVSIADLLDEATWLGLERLSQAK